MRPGNPLTRRLVALAGSVILLAGSLAVPAAAGAAGPAAVPAVRENARVTDLGTVDARAAARAAGGAIHAVSRPPLTIDRPALPRATGAPASVFGRVGPRAVASIARVVTSFPGIGEVADGLDLEPPDSWIAVSATHVVQATNGLVRMSSRAGTTLVAVPTWALFGLSPDMHDADPRILWDPAHGRWVGVLLGFIESGPTITYGSLTLAVSETSDPTGAWDLTRYGYYESGPSGNATLPDYPGISSSSDKVVISANEFDNTETAFLGSSLLVVRWSDLLAGIGIPILFTLPDPGVMTIRPAIVQGAASVVHLIAEDAGTGDVLYAKLVGSAPPEPTWHSFAGVLAPFCAANAPRQPGVPATITEAVDERPTDAVWRANVLAFVSTCASGPDNLVRIVQLDTSTAIPTVALQTLGGIGGTDLYMGGLGFTRNGTLILTFTQSSPSQFATSYVVALADSSIPVLLHEGEATYGGTRWGDYVGVAPDPSGADAVWVAGQHADADGKWATTVARVAFDGTAPAVTGPTQALVAGTRVSTHVPVRVGWTASDPGSGIASTDLGVDTFGAGLRWASTGAAGTSVIRSHAYRGSTSVANRSYQYAVSAIDAYGNASPQVLGPKLTPVVYQQTSGVTYAGTWKSSTSGWYLGGSVRYSSSKGASATFRTSGRSFGFVTVKTPSRGKVRVYVDGKLKTTLNLRSSVSKFSNLAYVVTFGSSATHTIKLVVVSGRVDIDGFVVLK